MQSVPSNLWQWLEPLHADMRVGLMVCVLAAIVVIVGIVCATIVSIYRRRAEVSLKREMLDRGMSAEEIAMVIRSRPAKARKCGDRVTSTV